MMMIVVSNWDTIVPQMALLWSHIVSETSVNGPTEKHWHILGHMWLYNAPFPKKEFTQFSVFKKHLPF